MGSPWLPVVIMTTRSSGRFFKRIDTVPGVGRDLEVSHVQGNLGVGDHALAVQDHLSVEHDRNIDDLLNAMNIGGKGGHDDPPFCTAEHSSSPRLTSFSENVYPPCPAFVLSDRSTSVPLSPYSAKVRKSMISPSTGVGSILKSPVCTIAADGGCYAQTDAVDDAVSDPDELDLKTAEFHHVPRLYHRQLNFVVQLVFPEFLFHEPKREAGAVDRDLYLAQKKGEGADMVFVPVGQHYAPDAFLVLEKIGKIRDDDIHAEHFRIGKHESGVYDDHVAAVFQDGHIQADLADTAERDDREGFSVPVRGEGRGCCGMGLLHDGLFSCRK